jgi:hypothetical protein
LKTSLWSKLLWDFRYKTVYLPPLRTFTNYAVPLRAKVNRFLTAR